MKNIAYFCRTCRESFRDPSTLTICQRDDPPKHYEHCPNCGSAEILDYRALILKYIAWIGLQEGTDFLGGDEQQFCFTPAEWDELETLSAESDSYRYR